MAKECIKSQSFTIRPLGFTDTLTVHLDGNCNCSCDEQLDPTACSGKGSVVCGICRYVLSPQNTVSNANRAAGGGPSGQAKGFVLQLCTNFLIQRGGLCLWRQGTWRALSSVGGVPAAFLRASTHSPIPLPTHSSNYPAHPVSRHRFL